MRSLSYPIRRHELYELIDSGEGSDVEFKRRFSSPEKIAREIIAFANTRGGYILFGVDDDGTVVGVRSEKSELEEIEHAAHFMIEPPADIITENVHAGRGLDIVLVRVPESHNKPHHLVEYDSSGRRAKEQTATGYVRYEDKSVLASKEMMQVMRGARPESEPLKLSIGYNERALFDYLERYGRITLDEFAELVNISHRRASKILVSLVRAGTIMIHAFEKTEFYTLR
ncbi:MAG: putative DNA binding domain-containing protein [Bacteroidota bacterium]|nr:putative DNA binding domain-containing protein [Bacteroidota bacterium]MDP4233371.1 putative DNA binding domain-containing protein [Bacteroidota bacterium]MDP4242237.1 putative DNA binding domain-containing protein [Bacteroidota bacterium]MDP4286993.1 putative DNA binding domain-containing protein [Bacteroidota bacterium]